MLDLYLEISASVLTCKESVVRNRRSIRAPLGNLKTTLIAFGAPCGGSEGTRLANSTFNRAISCNERPPIMPHRYFFEPNIY